MSAPIRRITPEGVHHFHGYYDIQPWDATGRFFVCLRVGFADRPPRPDDRATLGMVDLETGEFKPLAETCAWNFQQGTMAHWLGSAPDRKIVFNSREGDRFVSVALDVHSGERRILPQAVAAVSPDGRAALGLNFARVAVTRPGYGYAGLEDPHAAELHPEGDGIHHLDIETGETKLIVSMAQIARDFPHPAMDGSKMWFNHALYCEDGTRFAFLVRFVGERPWRLTGMFTADIDGGNLHKAIDYGLVSHYDWLGSNRILVWAGIPDRDNAHFYLLKDRTGEAEVVGANALLGDGHCSVSPDGRWVLNDTYPGGDPPTRALMLFNLDSGERTDLGKFLAPPTYAGEIRCDLHPCWSRDGAQVSFDSIHEGYRAVYVADVGKYVRP